MDPLTVALVIIGFAGIALAGARFGAGSTMSITGGLFPRSGQPGWPKGMQEGDAPHFAIDRLGGTSSDQTAAETGAQRDPAMLEPVSGAEPHWRR
jgi:hypothetical protein